MLKKEEIRKEAQRSRKEFIERVYSKKPEEILDSELWIIHKWLEIYRGEII